MKPRSLAAIKDWFLIQRMCIADLVVDVWSFQRKVCNQIFALSYFRKNDICNHALMFYLISAIGGDSKGGSNRLYRVEHIFELRDIWINRHNYECAAFLYGLLLPRGGDFFCSIFVILSPVAGRKAWKKRLHSK